MERVEQTISLGGYTVLTNVGATYDAAAPARGLGIALIDFSGAGSADFALAVNKVGTGVQSWQLWNETDGVQVAALDDDGAAGNKVLTGTIPAAALPPSGVKLVRVRVKSTIAADDPVYYGATLKLNRPPRDFERNGLVAQIVQNVYGLIANMRDNAADYKARVAGGQDAATVGAVMKADADRYLERLSWLTDVVTRNQALVTNALGDLGMTLGQANALKQTLEDAANHTKAATLTSTAEVNAEADWILANVPNYERLW